MDAFIVIVVGLCLIAGAARRLVRRGARAAGAARREAASWHAWRRREPPLAPRRAARAGALTRELGARPAPTSARSRNVNAASSWCFALAPVQETLQSMQQKVTELERDRQSQYGSLAEQLRARPRQRRGAAGDDRVARRRPALQRDTRRLGRDAVAARGRVRGSDPLRRLRSAGVGLRRRRGRPDMIVRLPGGKSLAVDAKVPLDAYLEASAMRSPRRRGGHRRAGCSNVMSRAVRAHVDALAKKSYWSGLDSSPEFVVCFLPSEALLATALEEDPTLLDTRSASVWRSRLP
jgi:DNA recombination protein RmuC